MYYDLYEFLLNFKEYDSCCTVENIFPSNRIIDKKFKTTSKWFMCPNLTTKLGKELSESTKPNPQCYYILVDMMRKQPIINTQ